MKPRGKRKPGRQRPKRYFEKEVKRKCHFCVSKVKEIDYRDTSSLRRYITEKGKILPSRVTYICARHQRQLARAIKRARYLGLLPSG